MQHPLTEAAGEADQSGLNLSFTNVVTSSPSTRCRSPFAWRLVALQSVISLAVLVVVSGPSHQHLALMPTSIRRPSG